MIGSWSALPSSDADERVEAPAQPVVGDPDGRAEAAEARRGGVEQLAGRVEAARERRAERGQRVELAAEVAQQRPALVGEGRAEAGGRVERLGELEELRRVQPAAAGRPLDRRPDVVRGADADARALLEQARGPGRSRRGRGRRGPGRSTARAPRRGGATAGTRSSRRAAPGRAGTRAARCERASIGRPVSGRVDGAGRRRDGCPRSTNRHGGAPRLAGVADADPRRRLDDRRRLARRCASRGAAATPGRTGPRPVQRGRCRTRPRRGPGRSPAASPAVARCRSAAAAAALEVALDGASSRRRRGRHASPRPLERLDGADRARAARPPAGPVTTFRQSCIP